MVRARSLAVVWVVGVFACVPPPPPPPPPAPVMATPSASASSSAPAAASSSVAAPRMAPPAPDAKPPADLGRGACKAGQAQACDVLAEFWGAREFLPAGRDAEARESAEILKVACEAQNVSSACMGYALMLKYGTATGKRDSDAGKPYWARLPKLGDLNGFREGTSEEGRAALASTQRACEDGRPRACNQIGWASYSGVQRDKSLPDSFQAYAEACRLGSAHGCRWAGHLAFVYPELQEGKNAKTLLMRGCSGDNPSACAELGQLTDKTESGAQSLRFYEQACSAGSRDGCFFAAKAKLAGAKERKDGVELLRRACDAEQEEACDLLGPMLERGDGLKKDEAAAILAYQRGCKGKLEGSCAALSRLAGAGKGARCVLDPKKPPRIGEPGVRALRAACKEHEDAAWCKGIVGCP